MKEIYFALDSLHPTLKEKFQELMLSSSQASQAENSGWVTSLLQEINFTNEFQVSLFHEGFASGNSPNPPEDILSVLFIKLHEAKIFGDPTEEIFFHGFISSWDTTKEPSIFLMKGYSRDDVNELINNHLMSELSLILM